MCINCRIANVGRHHIVYHITGRRVTTCIIGFFKGCGLGRRSAKIKTTQPKYRRTPTHETWWTRYGDALYKVTKLSPVRHQLPVLTTSSISPELLASTTSHRKNWPVASSRSHRRLANSVGLLESHSEVCVRVSRLTSDDYRTAAVCDIYRRMKCLLIFDEK